MSLARPCVVDLGPISRHTERAERKRRKRRQRKQREKQKLAAAQAQANEAAERNPATTTTAAAASTDQPATTTSSLQATSAAGTEQTASPSREARKETPQEQPVEADGALPVVPVPSATPRLEGGANSHGQPCSPVRVGDNVGTAHTPIKVPHSDAPAGSPATTGITESDSDADSGSDSDTDSASTVSSPSSDHTRSHARTRRRGGEYHTVYSSGDEEEDSEAIVAAGITPNMHPRRLLSQLRMWRRRCHRLTRRVATLENTLVGASALRMGGTGMPGVAWIFRPRTTSPSTGVGVVEGITGQGDQSTPRSDGRAFRELKAGAPHRRPFRLMDATFATHPPVVDRLDGAVQKYVGRVYELQRQFWYGEQPLVAVEKDGRGHGAGTGVDGAAAERQEAAENALDAGRSAAAEVASTARGALRHATTTTTDGQTSAAAAAAAAGGRPAEGTDPRWEDPWWLVSNLRRAAAAWYRGNYTRDRGHWMWFARNLVIRRAVQMVEEVRFPSRFGGTCRNADTT